MNPQRQLFRTDTIPVFLHIRKLYPFAKMFRGEGQSRFSLLGLCRGDQLFNTDK